jgi:hypothetical protein
MNLALFPKNEDWGTGDEALDMRLSSLLKKTAENLSLETIAHFYFFGLALKPRTYNPGLPITIELVTKALLFHFAPDEYNDVLLKKCKGHYYGKKCIEFKSSELEILKNELFREHIVRYKNLLDFSYAPKMTEERNPYILQGLKVSPYELSCKILFKELRFFLSDESILIKDIKNNYSDLFITQLRGGKIILKITEFAEIWFDVDQIFSFDISVHKS